MSQFIQTAHFHFDKKNSRSEFSKVSIENISFTFFKVGILVTIVGDDPSFFFRKEVPSMLGQCPGAPDSELLSQHTKTVWCSSLLLVSARTPAFHTSQFSRQAKRRCE